MAPIVSPSVQKLKGIAPLWWGLMVGVIIAFVVYGNESLSAYGAMASLRPIRPNDVGSGGGSSESVDASGANKAAFPPPVEPAWNELPPAELQEFVAPPAEIVDVTKQGLKINPSGPCDVAFRSTGGVARPSGSPPRVRVAISLVLMQRDDWLAEMLASLIQSDIMEEADVTIFAWLNEPGSAADKYMREYQHLPVIIVPNPSGGNEGIVIPRVRVMEAVLAHGCNFAWYLEGHDDMYFYKNWFKQLIAHDKPEYAMLMPFIVNGLATVEKGQTMVEFFTKDLDEAKNVVYINCIQVHPWLLKRAFVEDVGYFDEAFSPHQYEDDDLYIRLIRAGWKTAAIRSSWVVHRGGMTRGHFLPAENGNDRKFKLKHGIDASDFKVNLLSNCHPAAEDTSGFRFSMKEAP